MSNGNYIAGRNFEYKVMKQWAEHGCMCLRTAGSRGKFDIIAVHPGHGVTLIQCKVTAKEGKAIALISKFRDNPPLPPGDYHQAMVVYIKELRQQTRIIV